MHQLRAFAAPKSGIRDAMAPLLDVTACAGGFFSMSLLITKRHTPDTMLMMMQM
jgi:hypothetical protein